MTDSVQKRDWKNSQYEHPQHDWVCDHQCDGKTCPEGPLPDGTCPQVDIPCQPKQSLRDKRRITTIIFSSLSLSFCLCLFGGSTPSPLMSPGDVVHAHAFIQNDCAKCHSAAESDFSEWANNVLNSDIVSADSERCLKCHPKMGPNPLNPHGLPTSKLAGITQRIQKSPQTGQQPALLSLAAILPDRKDQPSLACATCHQEHHGQKFDLTQLSDLQCQSCHSRQFESFNHGHPPLSDYPYKRRTRIYFDHAKHFLQHFSNDDFKRIMPAGSAPTSCTSCHQADSANESMITRSFEQMCASCHERQIVDQEFPGIPFFALPEFSPALTAKNNDLSTTIPIGEWPAQRSESGESALPSLMELLLADDPRYREAVGILGNSVPRRLIQASRKHPDAVEKYLWSIKNLIYAVVQNGESELAKRLGPEYKSIATMKPSIVQSLITVQRLWFPHLVAEVRARRAGRPLETKSRSTATEEKRGISMAEHTSGGGWYIREADYSVRYRPLSHTDELLRVWMEQSLAAGTATDESENRKTRALRRMFRLLENPSASGNATSKGPISSGRCFQCHSVDRDSSTGKLQINWQAFRPQHRDVRLTKFSHAPHTQNLNQQKCASCHQFSAGPSSTKALFRPEFFERNSDDGGWSLNTNPRSVQSSGFLPMKKSKCVECHNTQTAEQSCLKCHDYHTH